MDMKAFEINQEEIGVLKAIDALESTGKKTDFHSVIETLKLDNSGMVIPVLSRLEEDGYLSSNGVVYRYFHLTEKGKSKIAE